MPRGDATGPMGMGPMTGRGAGYCAGYGMPGHMNNFVGRTFRRGAGFGGRGGRGGGFGFRNRFYNTGVPGWLASTGGIFSVPYPETDPDMEKQVLNNQAEILQKELNTIKKRLEELNTKAQK